jgi:hypothetical protein
MNRDKFFLLPFEVDVETVPEKLHMTVLELKTSEQCESKLMTIPVKLYSHQDGGGGPSAHKWADSKFSTKSWSSAANVLA